jgi:Calx-beta domain/Fibronectin type III domain/PKD domain
MSKRNRSGAIWRAVCSTIDNCIGFLGNSFWILAEKNAEIAEAFRRWGQIEPLERRVYLAGTPYVVGPLHAIPGHSYVLDLVPNTANSAPFNDWVINWGDSSTVTLSSALTLTTHTFSSASSGYIISATAYDSSGDIVAESSLGIECGTNGRASTNSDNGASAIAIESDGDVIALMEGADGYELERFYPNGSQDMTFGDSGFVPLNSTYSWTCLTVGSNGDIAVGGFEWSSSTFVMAIYKPQGTGTLVQCVGGTFANVIFARANDIAYAGGEIAIAGDTGTYPSAPSSYSYSADLSVFKYSAGTHSWATAWQAQIDTSTNVPAWEQCGPAGFAYETIAIDPGDGYVSMTKNWYYDGSYYGGSSYSGEQIDQLQWSPSGNLIRDFATPAAYDPIIAVQPSGQQSSGGTSYGYAGVILLGGQDLEEFTPNGTADADFGMGGYEPISFNQVLRIVSLSDDQILVLGEDSGGNDLLALYEPNGDLDPNFGNNGIVTGLFQNSSNDGDPQVAQLSNGDYEVAAIDGDGAIDITQVYNTNAVQVGGSLLNVTVDPISSATSGSPLTLNAAVTSIEPSSDSLGYQWTVKDDGSAVTLPNGGATVGPELTFTPNSSGTWSASVTVTDETLSDSTTTVSASTTNSFTVAPQPFQVAGPQTATAGDTLDYTAAGPGASTAFWIVTNNGTPVLNAEGSTLNFVPSQPGDYVVQADALNGTTNALTSSVNVQVADAPLNVKISGSAIAFQGRPIVLTSTVSDPSEVDQSLTYSWVLGDASGAPILIDGSGSAPLYTGSLSTYLTPAGLQAPNTFTAILTVTDGEGQSVTKDFEFQILADPGEADYEDGFLPVEIDPSSGTPNQTTVNPYAIAEEPNGNILVAGIANNLPGSDPDGVGGENSGGAFIAEFNSDLTLDTEGNFGDDGIITNAFGTSLEEFSSTTILSIAVNTATGAIIVAGIGAPQDSPDNHSISQTAMIVAELTSDGTPDPDFNGGSPWCSLGTWTGTGWDSSTPDGFWSETPYDIVVLPNNTTLPNGTQVPDGTFLVAGSRTKYWLGPSYYGGPDYDINSEDDFLLAEFSPSPTDSLNTAFGEGGYAQSVDPMGLGPYGASWDSIPDGTNGLQQLTTLPGGTLTSWTGNDTAGADAYLAKVIPLYSGTTLTGILAAGSADEDVAPTVMNGTNSYTGTGMDFVLAEYKGDGCVDDGFGPSPSYGGKVITNFQYSYGGTLWHDDYVSSMEMLAPDVHDGDILVVGNVPAGPGYPTSNSDATPPTGTGVFEDLGMAWFTTSGQPDGQVVTTTEVGVTSSNSPDGDPIDRMSAVAFESNGQIDVAMPTFEYDGPHGDDGNSVSGESISGWSFARLNPDETDSDGSGLVDAVDTSFGSLGDGLVSFSPPPQFFVASPDSEDTTKDTGFVGGSAWHLSPNIIASSEAGIVAAGPLQFDTIGNDTTMVIRYQSISPTLTDLTASGVGEQSIQLNWQAPTQGLNLGYEIERAPVNSDGTPGAFASIGYASAEQTSYVDTDPALVPGTSYYYTVYCVNGFGDLLGSAGPVEASTFPTPSGYGLVESIIVPPDGTVVECGTTLLPNVNYIVRASGNLYAIAPNGDSYIVDAEYIDDTTTDSETNVQDTATGPVDVGIAINGIGSVLFAQSNYEVYEDVGTATFAITRVDGLAGALTVQYSTTNSSSFSSEVGTEQAQPDVDYANENGSIIFAQGQSTATIEVPILPDSTDLDSDKVFLLQLTEGTLTSTATVTIMDDTPEFTLSPTNPDVAPGQSETFTITGNDPGTASASIIIATEDGSAVASSDYTAALNQTLTFSQGLTIQTFTVQTTSTAPNGSFFFVTMNNPADSSEDATATVTISNSTTENIGFDSANYTFTQDDQDGILNVVRTGGWNDEVEIPYLITPVSGADGALPGFDFNAPTSGLVTFNVGETTATINVFPLNDNLYQPDKTFTVTLDNTSSNITLNTSVTTVTIQCVNQPATVFVDSSPYPVPVSDSVAAVTVDRQGDIDNYVTVDYSTADGTATSGDDNYDPIVGGVLTFAPGQTSATVNVTLNPSHNTSSEYFYLDLFQDSSYPATLGNATATINLVNTVAPTLSFSPQNYIATEGQGDEMLTVVRTGDSSSAVTVTYNTASLGSAPGDAQAGTDYTVPSNTSNTLTLCERRLKSGAGDG